MANDKIIRLSPVPLIEDIGPQHLKTYLPDIFLQQLPGNAGEDKAEKTRISHPWHQALNFPV